MNIRSLYNRNITKRKKKSYHDASIISENVKAGNYETDKKTSLERALLGRVLNFN